MSDKPIQVGDLVMVVRGFCCPQIVGSPVFVVAGFWKPPERKFTRCAHCLWPIPNEIQALDGPIPARAYPLSWLMKIDPPAESQHQHTIEELNA